MFLQTAFLEPTLSSFRTTIWSQASAKSPHSLLVRYRTWPQSRTQASTAISKRSAWTSRSAALDPSSCPSTTLVTTTFRPIGSYTRVMSKWWLRSMSMLRSATSCSRPSSKSSNTITMRRTWKSSRERDTYQGGKSISEGVLTRSNVR